MTIGRSDSIPDAAERLGLTQRTLNRHVMEWAGLPPRQFQILGRTLHACELLRKTPLTVGAVALASGFYDHATFCRRFKQLTGCSPTGFRALPEVYWLSL